MTAEQNEALPSAAASKSGSESQPTPVLLTKRERNVVAYALLHYARALEVEDAKTGGYDGPLETADDCRLLSDKVRSA